MNPFKNQPGYLRDEGALGLFVIVIIGFAIFLIYKSIVWVINLINSYGGVFLGIIILIILIGIILKGFKTIPKNHKGLLLELGKRTNTEYTEGLKWHLPFITEIEVVDCTFKYIDTQQLRINMANYIPATIDVSGHFRPSDLYNFFNNYSGDNLSRKVINDITTNLREYLTSKVVDENELLYLSNVEYLESQISKINQGFLKKIGLEIVDIKIGIIQLDFEMQQFYSIIRQADFISQNKGLSYEDALKNSMAIHNKARNDFNTFNLNSDTVLEGLKQLKRLKRLANQ